VLSAEQAAGGLCERCDTEVEERQMRQWFLRLSAYAQRLLDNLEWIDWSAITKSAQQRWIGRSEGAEIRFTVKGSDKTIEVFTTRPDTLWGATYLVLAPEHPLLTDLCQGHDPVLAYVEAAKQKTAAERQQIARDKTGVFSGAHVLHPTTGQPLPVWISDYVLMGYGTGAIMAVPAHDDRDFAFAQAFGLKIAPVIVAADKEQDLATAYTGPGRLINSGPFNGMDSQQAKAAINTWLQERGLGQAKIQYRLRDWCISRQRYWGPPIPMVHCPACGTMPVPEAELPVLLPSLEDFAPDGTGRSPLARCEAFVHTPCPQCGDAAQAFDRERTQRWLPVDIYIGGNEHAVLHLIYTRFLTMALRDMGLIDFEEPFKRFRANGMIVKDGAKMSKSKGNVVNPDEYLDRYGTDALRTYLMFAGNFQEGGNFRDQGIHGVQRFLDRLWRYASETTWDEEDIADAALLQLLHQKIHKVTEDLEHLHYNTAIPTLMELLSGLQESKRHYRRAIKILLQLVAPFAPCITQELWQSLGETGQVADAAWPQADSALMHQECIEWVVQVNGRRRDRLDLTADLSQQEVEAVAFSSERVRALLEDKQILKTIFVPQKLVNIVVR
jgi:leucyl-tRNA synthetase